ncbi:MAG: 3-deoxy-D-manno-octulosonic acid transferase [Limisphaerales bacterium]
MKETWSQRFSFRAYQAAMHVGLPTGILLGLPWMLFKAKRRKTVFRRLGFQGLEIPRGGRRPLWVHALSLGETLSCVSLVKELRRVLEGRPLVMSVSTLSAREMAEERLGGVVDGIFYFPFDLVPSIGRVLGALDPAMVVLVETDIWPGFQRAIRLRGITEVLVNGRLSPGSYRSCRRFGALFTPALNSFDRIFPQSRGEAERYGSVGVEVGRLGSVGNLKFDVAGGVMDADALIQLRGECGLVESSRVVIAGSTHPGEEEQVLAALGRLRERWKDLRLVLVPRHPRRGAELQAMAEGRSLRVARWSRGPVGSGWDVLVVDVMGKLASLYQVADVAFVGGSLANKGGQNPIEPAATGKPVLFGPDMSDFPDISRELLELGAACEVSGAGQLAGKLEEILSDAELAERMGASGRAFVESHRGTTQRVVEWIGARLSA